MTQFGPLPPQSNRADFIMTVDATNDDGTPLDITDSQIFVTLSDRLGCARIKGSTSDGRVVKEVPEGGEFSITIRADALACLQPGNYRLAIVFKDGADTSQPYEGDLPIFEGPR